MLDETLSFFRAFETWIYLLLGVVGLFFIRKFTLAWQELREAGFGLERVRAQGRLNQAASVLVLLLVLAVTEFVMVSFIAPTVPGATPLLTPTLNLLATPTTTLEPAVETAAPAIDQPAVTPGEVVSATVANPTCLVDQAMISQPQEGLEVNGIVQVDGTANLPSFGFYKIEMKRPNETNWLTIQAGNIPVQNGKLGDWDTRRLTPGEYQLGLVVVNNQAQALPHCIVKVRVTRTVEGTPTP